MNGVLVTGKGEKSGSVVLGSVGGSFAKLSDVKKALTVEQMKSRKIACLVKKDQVSILEARECLYSPLDPHCQMCKDLSVPSCNDFAVK